MQLIIAEKPSVARDIARVLGVRPRGRGSFAGQDRFISWCVGHLVELDEPAAYDQRWKPWRLDTLPMVPDQFRLRPVKSATEQLRAVRALLCDTRFDEVVNACDAGREGELIFRYVYQLAGSRLPIRRLWISSMTDEAIQAGFAGLRPGAHYDNLANAARCRSEADWIVGLNATRAVTVRHRTGPGSTLYSIGRVQTPTLAILAEREQAIQQFVPRDYWELRGTFTAGKRPSFMALWTRDRVTRFGTQDAVTQVTQRVREHGEATDPDGPVVERVTQRQMRERAPLLFDLTALQRTANRRFGLSANQTLQAAQALYEQHKVLTYPRTDARYLSRDMVGDLPTLFRGLARYPDYQSAVQPLVEKTPRPSARIVDDTKVQDHHAIIPTGQVVALGSLTRDERRIFDLVVRRFVGAFYPDAVFATTTLVVRVGAEVPGDTPTRQPTGPEGRPEERLLEDAPPPPDRFIARGRVRLEAGWQAVAGLGDDGDRKKTRTRQAGAGEAGQVELPAVRQGQKLSGTFESPAKQTKPPPHHSEASLLLAMETAGKQVDDEALRAAMKDTGLGTPATRASIIETLIRRDFVDRTGKQLHATPTGMALIDAVPVPNLTSPELTGQWEARLARIARGQDTRAAFMRDIASYVREIITVLRRTPINRSMARARVDQPVPKSQKTRKTRTRRVTRKSTKTPRRLKPPRFNVDDLRCPLCKQGHLITGQRGWGCERWRGGCTFVVWFESDGKRLTKAQLKNVLDRSS